MPAPSDGGDLSPPPGDPTIDHYFTPAPASGSAPIDIRVVVDGAAMHLTSDAGVFSSAHLDPGTAVLLRRAPAPPPTGALLDLGCGYGAITCALARRAPGATVLGVDVNSRARDLTLGNARRLGLPNVIVQQPDEVDPATRFAAIYSNPPIHVGKPRLHELLMHWLPRLEPGGRAYLVVHRHLGSDSLQRWLDSVGFPCERLASVRGYRVIATGR